MHGAWLIFAWLQYCITLNFYHPQIICCSYFFLLFFFWPFFLPLVKIRKKRSGGKWMFVWYINRAKMFKFANKPVNEFLICVNCGHFFEKKKKKKPIVISVSLKLNFFSRNYFSSYWKTFISVTFYDSFFSDIYKNFFLHILSSVEVWLKKTYFLIS